MPTDDDATRLPSSPPPLQPEDDLRELLLGLAGRLPRKAFWLYGVVGLTIAQLLAYLLLGIAGVKDAAADVVSTLLIAWPSFAITAKRWHDRDKSAWWVLINLVPVIGILWTLIECGFLRGTIGANRYGGDPVTGA